MLTTRTTPTTSTYQDKNVMYVAIKVIKHSLTCGGGVGKWKGEADRRLRQSISWWPRCLQPRSQGKTLGTRLLCLRQVIVVSSIGFINWGVDDLNLPPWKVWQTWADVSSIGPSSERMKELWAALSSKYEDEATLFAETCRCKRRSTEKQSKRGKNKWMNLIIASLR